MDLTDVRDRLTPLIEEVEWAQSLLKSANNKDAKRAYVRSLFAFIEGSVWILKQTILNNKSENTSLTEAEIAMLSDNVYELNGKGEIKTITKYPKIQDNIKFTFKTLEKCYKIKLEIDTRSDDWNQFQSALKVRNRITHPKEISDFEVSDSEIISCNAAHQWFGSLVSDFINGLPRKRGKT